MDATLTDLTDPTVTDDGMTPARRASIARAIGLGADTETILRLRGVARLSQKITITIPAHRYEGLSRGRGWARLGRGQSVTWGDRVERGYRVGPGYWTVGGHDGYSRKGEDQWTVEHVMVGDETWTVAQ
jgi:hypothetical protein